MRIITRLPLYISTLIIFSASCGNGAPLSTESFPDIPIPINELNTKIRVEAAENFNSFLIGDSIGLDIELISNEVVAFPINLGARLFIYEDHTWIEVGNSVSYPAVDGYIFLLRANDDPFSKFTSTTVKPILPNPNEPVTVRIFIIGNIYQNEQITDEQTGAFVDVRLTPNP